MNIALYEGKFITADEFVAKFGTNYKHHNNKAKCSACSNELTLKNGLSDSVNCFTHSKNSNCPLVTINRKDIPHIKHLKKDKNNTGIELRNEIANNVDMLVDIYIRTHKIAGSGNMSIWQFCKLLLLSIERDIWNLKDLSAITLPYLLVQLDDFPIEVAEYKVVKEKDNQFRFFLALKTKKSSLYIFKNYYIKRLQLNKDSTLDEWIRNIPTPGIENAKSDWLKQDTIDLLVERSKKILISV